MLNNKTLSFKKEVIVFKNFSMQSYFKNLNLQEFKLPIFFKMIYIKINKDCQTKLLWQSS